jgi:hypothetical protein
MAGLGQQWCRRRQRGLLNAMRPFYWHLVAIVIACCGCSDGRSTVSGTVTFNGDALSRGSITLVPVDGKGQAAGGDVTSGRYIIKGVSPGEKSVQISAQYVSGKTTLDGGLELDVVSDLLPASWGPASKERLTVTAPTTTKDFAIEGPDPRKK